MKRLIPVLKSDGVDSELIMLIRTILAASKEIAFRVSQGELAGILGSTLVENIQGEVQKQLDVVANELLKDMLLGEESVRSFASEEEDHVVAGHEDGQFVVAFDPLDGSSNIDVNGQIGTIFTIYKAKREVPADSAEQFAQQGKEQLCAGYVLYGPSTLLVMTTGGPTRCYTLDLTHGGFLLTQPELRVPKESKSVAVNMANFRFWPEATRQFFEHVMFRSDSFSGASIRWNAAMVGDVHRVLCSGGLFAYPGDKRQGIENGKIRLLYEANPLALLVEKAGGTATSNGKAILDIKPSSLHQRVPVALGSEMLVREYNESVH